MIKIIMYLNVHNIIYQANGADLFSALNCSTYLI